MKAILLAAVIVVAGATLAKLFVHDNLSVPSQIAFSTITSRP